MGVAHHRAGMHGHGGDQRRMPQCHQRRHASPRGQARDVDPLRVQSVPRDFRSDQRRDQVGLGAPMLVIGLEPPPAALDLTRHGLLRVQHHETACVGPLIHARAAGKCQ
ncbi:hypothetical protein G6F64_014429 [Rhizopus arrhizus]|uniref:Uncharacterized protein n=1 Tax=Rhizopus oryzae TaxID=64495 RepID=A0A9P6WTW9_RHIOR|nr:hypothetical protein G6F64_014429 [Rhizopus arrhizus]